MRSETPPQPLFILAHHSRAPSLHHSISTHATRRRDGGAVLHGPRQRTAIETAGRRQRAQARHSRADGKSPRPGLDRFHQVLRQPTHPGHRQRGIDLSQVAHQRRTDSAVRDPFFVSDSLCGLQPEHTSRPRISARRRAGGRSDLSVPAHHDEVHQPRHAGSGDDVRSARQRNGQHGGHPWRRRYHPRRERDRQKRMRPRPDRTRLQPRVR